MTSVSEQMEGPPNARPTFRHFAPELWGQADYFLHFAEANVTLSAHARRALGGIKSHMMKVVRFRRIADQIRPGLNLDRVELHRQGYSPQENAVNFTLVVEAAIMELYGTVDCVATVIHGVYGKRCQSLPESTSKLFKNVAAIIGPFPDDIRGAISAADWYPTLLELRSELTHLGTGHCRIDVDDGPVSYTLRGLRSGQFLTEDVIGWIDTYFTAINEFVGTIFHRLNADLTIGQSAMCGMVEGRPLMRHINPELPLTFQSGVCLSTGYLAPNGDTRCPWQDECQPYQRALANPPGPNGEAL